MAGHSCPKDGVASLAYVPAIHACLKEDVDARHKAGHDVESLNQSSSISRSATPSPASFSPSAFSPVAASTLATIAGAATTGIAWAIGSKPRRGRDGAGFGTTNTASHRGQTIGLLSRS